jgi:hypothetical protein
MHRIIKKIQRANARDIAKLLDAVLRRYEELYPDWELTTISLQKSSDRNQQLNKLIDLLQQMKVAL